ncbi:hypothetical protein N7474_008347 [Penicillium riverlandense]|uniref:uncharacterized protein n=1 Tax=Penicillium riverlandense TaxID=1903569 RepID=UPI002546ABAD|nr:uncharacterized protein N7474_008347 [Penicillium riverlandense]KAJ5812046.1 hypothetical protein N7474_008347 [Penicillium riverlandense]
MIDEDKNRWVGELYGLLNRTDVFTDFSQLSSIGSHVLSSSDRVIGLWNFLRQVIVAKELAMRLQTIETADNYAGFTWRTLSSLIVSDLWLRHVDMAIVDTSVDLHGIEIPGKIAKAEAERFNEMGDQAMSHRKYQEAFDAYGQAINVDLRSAIYRCKRSDASLAQGNYPEAEEDAHIATLLDPKYLKAWSSLGLALLKQGLSRRAETVHKKALEVADGDAAPAILQRLADARSHTQQTMSYINEERSLEQKHRLQSEFFAQDFETQRKEVEWHSRIHQQQMEGLLTFAQRLKWPYLDETQAYAKQVYSSFRDSGSINIHMWDWLFGLVFPGKWFALKIMAALVQCTPSISDNLGAAPFYECGLALQDRSYLRSRTVLARVLGCLPGVVSLCGWIGPCPALIFEEPVDESKPRYVRIKALVNSPLESNPTFKGIALVGPSVQEARLMQKQPWETLEGFVNDIKDPGKWTSPAPPARDHCSYRLREVRVSKLPADANVGGVDRLDAESQAEYRASLLFEFNNSHLLITYTLFTNPIFVTLPPCRSQALHGTRPGLHGFHERELPLFEGKIWSIGELKDHTPGEGFGGVSVINATGEGAEVIARAWCSERGRNATIRRPGGPCFACALRATNNSGLRIGVLIWVG